MNTVFKPLLPTAIVAAVLLWSGIAAVQAQSFGCAIEQASGAAQQVVRCQRGVTIIVEKGAGYALIDRDGDRIADGVRLRRKGLLLEVTRALGGSGFVVVTPQAIAAVRGTKWAVDAQPGRTSVFVVNGVVAVTRPAAGDGVTLRAGQGVDVERGTQPLVVKRWPQARVSALLARFGQ